ncbi:deoxyribonuclease V [bacterium]|nr:deoxyribonuclease V [bacterium]
MKKKSARTTPPYRADFSAREAIERQKELAGDVSLQPTATPNAVRHIAGVDASITRDQKQMIGTVVVFALPDLVEIDSSHTMQPVVFPYIPGLLSFRELPVVLEALRQLETEPDLLLVDGQGIAHPRRFGIASHLGVVSGLPTIGCAKSRLTGTCDEPGMAKGEWTMCMDGSERIGSLVRTRSGVKPVWVSPGHRVSHEQAVDWILRTATRYRLPDPIRAAHQLASSVRKQRGGYQAT